MHVLDEQALELSRLHRKVVDLEIGLKDLRGEATVYRLATIIAFALMAEKIWTRFFS
jgi:hypothetical protein